MTLPFFTALDPQARIAGSRDPLGVQPIWSHLGRTLVTNLTTVATSVRGFTTLMLGLHFASRLVEEEGHDETERLRFFLKLEQMVAWSRYAWQDETSGAVDGIRGIRRVRRKWEAHERRLPLGLGPDAQILSDQKTYGLWGLYSMAARDSGLRERAVARLTDLARTHLLSRWQAVSSQEGLRDDRGLMDLLVRDLPFEPVGRHKELALALARMMAPSLTDEEQRFYLEHLVHGKHGNNGPQARFWRHMETCNDDAGTWGQPFGLPELRRVRDAAHKAGDDDIVERLTWIADVESVLVPAGLLFEVVLASHGQAFDAVIREIRAAWGSRLGHIQAAGFRFALPRVAEAAGRTTAERLLQLAEALGDGDWAAAVELCLTQNAEVMAVRGSGPWAVVKDTLVDVRLRTEGVGLVDAARLPNLWVNPYYLGALKHVGGTVLRKGLSDVSVDDE